MTKQNLLFWKDHQMANFMQGFDFKVSLLVTVCCAFRSSAVFKSVSFIKAPANTLIVTYNDIVACLQLFVGLFLLLPGKTDATMN